MYLRQNSHMYRMGCWLYSSGYGATYHVSISQSPNWIIFIAATGAENPGAPFSGVGVA